MGEGLGTEGVRDLLPHQAGVQQLPLPVGQIVLEVHVTGPVGHIDLHKYCYQIQNIELDFVVKLLYSFKKASLLFSVFVSIKFVLTILNLWKSFQAMAELLPFLWL